MNQITMQVAADDSPLATQPPAGTPVTETASARRRWKLRAESLAWTVGSVGGGLLLWEIVARLEWVNPLFLPRFSTVMSDLSDLFQSGAIWRHLSISGQEYGLGMLLATVVGVFFGLLMGVSSTLDKVLSPWVHGLNAVPRIAFAPVLIVWFGFGMGSKIAMVFIMAVFPILLNTAVGAGTVDKRLTTMADSFLFPQTLKFRALILPSSVPYILTGVRLGVASGLIGVVVGEFFGSSAGVGYLLTNASYTFNSVRIFSMVVLLSVIGVALTTISKVVERRFDSWRQ